MRGTKWGALVVVAAVSIVPTATMAAPMVVKAKTTESGWVWSPKTRYVSAPKKVKWKNPTNEPHSVRFYKGPLKGVRFLLLEGDTKTKKIKKAGTYKYRCDLAGHSKVRKGKCSGMCGKLVAH